MTGQRPLDGRAHDLLREATAAYQGTVADPSAYGPVAARLVVAARQASHPEALVVALRAQAWSERARMEHKQARGLLNTAARVARRHRLDERLGEVLVTRAAVNLELGRPAVAQRDLDRAGSLGQGGSVELTLQQAVLLHNLGRLAEAATEYRRVLAIPRIPADVHAKVANNLAMLETQRNRYGIALTLVDDAAARAAEVGPALVAAVAQTRAWVTMQAGRLVESLRLFEAAGRLHEAAGLPLGEYYLEHADALTDLRLLPEADGMARRAAELFDAHGLRLMGAEAQLRVARLALLRGDHAAAAGAATRAAVNFRRQRRTAWAALATAVGVQARVQAGEVTAGDLAAARRAAATLDRLGMTSSAVDAALTAGRAAAVLGRAGVAGGSLRHAHELARRAPVLVRLKGRVAATLGASLRGDDAGVLAQCRAGLTDLTRHRAALASTELRALASGHGAELGRAGLRVLLRAESAPRVLEWMERTRAAALVAVEPPATAGIEDELAELRAVHTELDQARRADGVEPPELLARQTATEHRIRRVAWARQPQAAAAGAAPSLAELRGQLGGQLLVAYGALDGELFATVLEAQRTRLVRLGPLAPVRYETAALLFALRRLARPGADAPLAAGRASAEYGLRQLTRLLLEPLELPRDTGLVIVPLGELHALPWSALHPAPVSVAPSASFWARTRQRRARVDGRTVLVAGPDLPGSAAEVDALTGLHPQPTVLSPPASTVAAVASSLDGAALAHLACHGRLRADNPTFSSLLLSDGPLTVHELDRRGIAPHRMILAACDAGTDVSYEGNEMLGFVSTLIARGTAGLVASAVMVPDLEAVPLMRALHERVRHGATLAEALHAARATVDRESPRDFVSWCAFTVFGSA